MNTWADSWRGWDTHTKLHYPDITFGLLSSHSWTKRLFSFILFPFPRVLSFLQMSSWKTTERVKLQFMCSGGPRWTRSALCVMELHADVQKAIGEIEREVWSIFYSGRFYQCFIFHCYLGSAFLFLLCNHRHARRVHFSSEQFSIILSHDNCW